MAELKIMFLGFVIVSCVSAASLDLFEAKEHVRVRRQFDRQDATLQQTLNSIPQRRPGQSGGFNAGQGQGLGSNQGPWQGGSQGSGLGNQGLGSNGFGGQQSQGFGNQGLGSNGLGGQQSQGFGNQGLGTTIGNQGQGFSNGLGNQGQGFGNQGQGFGNQGQGFGNQGQGFGNQGQGFGNQGQSQGQGLGGSSNNQGGIDWTTQRNPFNIISNENSIDEQTTRCIQNCPAINNYNPVCGDDNITYQNAQKLQCAQQQCNRRVQAVYNGACVTTPAP